jgi:hypothetical protein
MVVVATDDLHGRRSGFCAPATWPLDDDGTRQRVANVVGLRNVVADIQRRRRIPVRVRRDDLPITSPGDVGGCAGRA